MVVYFFFFYMFSYQDMPVSLCRSWFFHNVGQMGVVGFIFGDSKSSFNPWVVFIYGVKTMLVMLNIIGLFPYSMPFTSHVSFTYSLAFPL